MPKLLLVFLLVIMNSCNSTELQNTKLLLDLENRVFSTDHIIKTKVFENGIIENIVLHSSSEPESIYQTRFKKLNSTEFNQFRVLLTELETMNYHNDFPWKEDLSKRGDVYKFQFLKKIQTKSFREENSEEVIMPVTYYYYSGLQSEPKVYSEIIKLINPKAPLPQE